jgi:hypothetical protein
LISPPLRCHDHSSETPVAALFAAMVIVARAGRIAELLTARNP